MAGVLITILMVIIGAVLLTETKRRREVKSISDVHDSLDRIEIMLLDERNAEGDHALREIWGAISKIRGRSGAALRVRHSLLMVELASNVGRRDVAQECVASARQHLASMEDAPRRDDLAARANALSVLIAAPDTVDQSDLKKCHLSLARIFMTKRPDVLMRLGWAAYRMGQIYQGRGTWDQAKSLYESTFLVAERLHRPGTAVPDSGWSADARERFWTFGHMCASNAALELASVARATGDVDEANKSYERAVRLLDGVSLPKGRVTRAKALMVRALYDSTTEIESAASRAAWVDQAVEEASAAGAWDLASQAEIQLAGVHLSMGSRDQYRVHLRRATECAKKCSGGVSEACAVHAQLVLGLHLEETEETPEARATFRAAYEGGRASAGADSRRMAAIAGAHLHALLLQGDEVDEASQLLGQVEPLVPTLELDARAPVSAVLAGCRGHQQFRERQIENAVRTLEKAVLLARQVPGAEGGALLRKAETDLGHLLAEADRLSESEDHLSNALAVQGGYAAPDKEAAEQANIFIQRARTRIKLGRESAALVDLDRAFELGRDSGWSHGRATAAVAVLLRGDLMSELTDGRRQRYEAAERLGLLSGVERGRNVAEQAQIRLRQMAE